MNSAAVPRLEVERMRREQQGDEAASAVPGKPREESWQPREECQQGSYVPNYIIAADW